jgi:predicted nucleic acid-binding protein
MLNVITDTSCLIVLSNIGQLDILRELYKTMLITPEVAAEFGEFLPEWIHTTGKVISASLVNLNISF